MNNKGADQTVRMRRLICAFVVRIWYKTRFLMPQLKYIWDPYCFVLMVSAFPFSSDISLFYLSFYFCFFSSFSFFFFSQILIHNEAYIFARDRILPSNSDIVGINDLPFLKIDKYQISGVARQSTNKILSNVSVLNLNRSITKPSKSLVCK